jgi:putative toxin-antitoxin system antitoxin component (TIGR02293 family)
MGRLTSAARSAKLLLSKRKIAMTILQLVAQPPATQVAAIERGLPSRALRQLVALLGVSQKVLLDALGLSPRTITHRVNKSERFSMTESERLLRVIRAQKLAREVFSTDAAVAQWLTTPDAALGRRTPLAMLSTDVGAGQVNNLLQAMIHGVPL